MHWDKSAEIRTRPYQGVRVRDPVKELLRRKRSAASPSTKTTPPTTDAPTFSHQSTTYGLFSSEPATVLSEGGLPCSGWRAIPTSSSSVPASTPPWSTADSSPQETSAPIQSYPVTPTLTTDLYMQTLCPSYTMLTYTHTPLLTNFGTIPVAPASTPLPQMDPDSGLTYLPWATMPSPAVQFSPGSAALTGSPLVHVPLSMSLATMIPQLDLQVSNGESQALEQPLDPVTEGQGLHEDPEVEEESSNLLDKLLEEQKADNEEDKDSYSNSIFVPNV